MTAPNSSSPEQASVPAADGSPDAERDPSRYDPAEVEPRWQRYWDEHQTFKSTRSKDPSRRKRYVLCLNPEEATRQRLHRLQNKASRHIHEQKHDAQVRG